MSLPDLIRHARGKQQAIHGRIKHYAFQIISPNRVKPRDAEVVAIRLLGAKNNQCGREELRFHHRSGDAVFYPVMAPGWVVKGAKTYGTQAG
ncbi:hypothetical protein GQ600_1223 [Phytophthora cactorum]|nr:hypothetical protein GQ600_1223 [Phytophthora cactorum]